VVGFNRNLPDEADTNVRIVVVLTSHDRLGNTGRKTGFWLEEFAAPYFVFRDAGVDLTLTSPKGGQPPLDPKSDLPENQTPAMTRFKQDTEGQKALAHTVKLADVNADDYDTVFYVGGHGPMWDLILPGNTSHFHWAKSGDYITQVTAIGPLGLEYINSKDDPRNESHESTSHLS
jgi:hypothetical protein